MLVIYPRSVLCWLGFISVAAGTICASSTSKEQKAYLTLSEIMVFDLWVLALIHTKGNDRIQSHSWLHGEEKKAHLISCSAGRSASLKLSIKSKTEVEWNDSSHHRFSPFCATEHVERKGRGGEGRKPLESGHDNCWTCLGVISEVVFKVHVPYLCGISFPLLPWDLNPEKADSGWEGRFAAWEMRLALKRRCLLSRGLSCMLWSLACSTMTMQTRIGNIFRSLPIFVVWPGLATEPQTRTYQGGRQGHRFFCEGSSRNIGPGKEGGGRMYN